jgi:hypothetical protein
MQPEPEKMYPFGVAWAGKTARDPSEGAPPDETLEAERASEGKGADDPGPDQARPSGQGGARAVTDEALEYEDELSEDEDEDEAGDAEDEDDDVGDPALSPEDGTLIQALVRGFTHREAGELIGRRAKSVQRWLKDPAFAAALERERTKHNRRLQSLLSPGAIRALQALLRLTSCERDADSIRACSVILRYDMQFRSLEAQRDLARRVAELESALAAEQADEDDAGDGGRY